MKFTNSQGDIFEGTVDEILSFYNRKDLKALPPARIQPKVSQERKNKSKRLSFICEICGKDCKNSQSYYWHTTKSVAHRNGGNNGNPLAKEKNPFPTLAELNERQRIIQKVALNDKVNGGL